MNFSKWHGQGNDFVIVNGFIEKINDCSKIAIAVCDRNFGIGADGLILILPSAIADFKVEIYNSDGSIAEMCGNGIRCAARYVYEENLTTKTIVRFETLAGIIIPELIFSNSVLQTIRVDMGEPRLLRGQIPMSGQADKQVIGLPLEVEDSKYYITAVSMGNPHCVIFVEDIAKVKLAEVGPGIETNKLFPSKTNVEFVEVKSKNELVMRVWERGAGITKACGTGACACTVAGVLNNKIDRLVIVHLDGGDLSIVWGADNHLYMSGPAVKVYTGDYPGI